MVVGLPSRGLIYVRLLSWIAGAWHINDYEYDMLAPIFDAQAAPQELEAGSDVALTGTFRLNDRPPQRTGPEPEIGQID